MSWIVALPLLIPFGAAAAALIAPRFGVAPRWPSLIGSALQLVAAVTLFATVWRNGVAVAAFGGWDAPLGITLVADTLAALMTLVGAGMGLAVGVYASADIDRRRSDRGWHALYQVLLAGATGAFLTGDLFNLYVWFEVMLIASFGLIVIGGRREQLDGAVKYVALNLVATLFFLTAIGLIHGMTGTLNMADLSRALPLAPEGPATAASLMLFGAFAVKAGLFPVFFWLPAAYHTPPIAVTAIFAGLLTKAGVYAIMRVFTLVFPAGIALEALLPIGIATMVVGVIGAAAHRETHRILSFHIVSQIGYMALGLAILTPLALAGAILYMVHNIVVKANLFLIAGVQRRLTGDFDLYRSGGLYAATPLLSALFLVSALAMAGLPPFSGFWGKLALVRAGAEEQLWVAVAATLGVGLFTLYSMTKIWLQGYLKPHPRERARPLSALPLAARGAFLAPIMALAGVSLAMGLAPDAFIAAAERAANELLDPSAYVAAVLGGPETAALRPEARP